MKHLENLNQPQIEAVNHHSGPILVLAGAGTGKTRVLTRRIANLILQHQVHPSSILAVTFTNKACKEMRHRLGLLLGETADRIWISTFHSAGLRILRSHASKLGYKNDFVVCDAQDTKEIIKGILKRKSIDEKRYPATIFSSFIDKQKHIPRYPEDIGQNSSDYSTSLKIEVYDLYQRELVQANAMDFGDLLALTFKLFREHPEVKLNYQSYLNYILVDEFQDTNQVQYDLIKMLSGAKKNVLVVGDDDQSIYAFRGATVENILHFERDFPETKVVKLEQNYRSSSNILEAAYSVISKNRSRKEKKVWTSRNSGDPIKLIKGYDENEEARQIAKEIKAKVDGGLTYQDIAVFYRMNAQSRALEEAFLSYRIPYRIFGGLKFYDRKEVKDVIAYLRLLKNRSDNQAFLRVVNTPTRGIGAQTINNLQKISSNEGISLFEAAERESKSGKSLATFVTLIKNLSADLASKPLFETIEAVIERSDYGPRLRALKDDPAAQSRLENLEELKSLSFAFDINPDASPLEQFLDRVALSSTDDNPDNKETPSNKSSDAVSLMTLHLAKGLEFDLVFLTGFEEGLIPHYKCMNDPDEVEEERRLCYVGITRARHSLFISRASTRGIFSNGGDGSSRFRDPSRFAFDLPKVCFQDTKGDFFLSVESSHSYDDADYEYDDSLDVGPGYRKHSSLKPKKMESAKIPSLFSAESLEPVSHLSVVSALEVKEGLRVVHPSFGRGLITRLDGDPGDKNSTFKVTVKFEKFEQEKRLVFRFAGLRLAESSTEVSL